jgi:CheY-like chemotaxis protein
MSIEIDDPVEILLVEDNPDDEELTLMALARYNIGNRIHVVRDGAEALEFVFARGRYEGRNGHQHPKLILLDIKLPLVDGLEVLRQVKSDPETRRIPVVLLTSSREESDIVTGYDNGTNSYIVKPVDFSQFGEAMRTVGMYWLLVNTPPAV